MARNRMIKPEFWEDDKIAECSPTARLLFVALWNFADDEGFLEYRIKWLKAKCLPYDNVKIEVLLGELEKVGRVEIKNKIIWIPKFLKHQKIDKPRASDLSLKFKDSSNDSRMIAERSTTKREREYELEKEKEREREESSKEEAPPKTFGNPEINKTLLAIKLEVGVDDFKESQKQQRIAGQNLYRLMMKITPQEFKRRIQSIKEDDFKSQHVGSLKYLYREIKAFVDTAPKSYNVTI